MSTLEAAASLFGLDSDSGPDPFSVIGNEATATDTTPTHDEQQPVHTSSHPFQMGQGTSSWLAEQMYPDAQQEQHDPWHIPTSQDTSSAQPHPSGLPMSYDHQQAYYPEPLHSGPYAVSPASMPYQSSSSSYDSHNLPPPIPYQPYNTSQPSAPKPYDPYKPVPGMSMPSASTPRQPTRQLSTIPARLQAAQQDTYKPAVRPVSSPYTASSVVASQPPPNGVPTQASKPTTAEFRPKASNAYDPPLPPPKVHRTVSPNSLRFVGTSQSVVSHVPYTPPTIPYDQKSVPEPPRTMSPGSIRSSSPALVPSTPSRNIPVYSSSQLRGRSSSNGSTLSSQGVVDSYQSRKEYGLGFSAHITDPNMYANHSHHPLGQDIQSRAVRPPYAPSPSLLGSNDPLSRTSSRAPVVSFGFGGKILTCFHSSADLNTGFDIALSSRRTTNVTIRVLHKLLPDYASEVKQAEYPGPLFSDPGTPVTSLVRTGMSQAKTKKARVIKYLEERAEEISRGMMYMSNNLERQPLEGKLVLVRLLRIMVENDGSLSGSPAIDNAVRAALLPRIADALDQSGHDGPAALASLTLPSPMPNAPGITSMLLPPRETPLSVSTLLPSALDTIQEFLVRGERRQAYHYALDERLWAHAMIIASSVDKEAWKEVVNEFLKTELGAYENAERVTSPHTKGTTSLRTNGREWLRVAYSVFSGQGPAAVQELVPMNLLSKAATGLQVPAPLLSHAPPASQSVAPQVPEESLSKWPEIVASIISSPLNPEHSAMLSALGDCLASHHFLEGAHVCYLLSPQTSSMSGLGGPGTRLVLLGSQSPHINPVFFRDPDPSIFTEIAEFALSLKTPAKGQEPFHGFPHLQAYKFIRAAYLADIGHIQSATRYCDAITGTMGRSSPYLTPTLVEGLRQLADRLLGSPHMDKSTSWIAGKVNKPSLDSIGSWLEVRLTKFIAGEGNDTPPPTSEPPKAQFVGPFSSYSSISSATTSASPSPPPTVVNSYAVSTTRPPRRSGSAMALPSTAIHVPVDRASSAMEYYRPARHASPTPKTAPLHPTEYHYSPYATQASSHSVVNGYGATYGNESSSRKTSLEMTAEEGPEVQSDLRDELHQDDQRQPKLVDGNQVDGNQDSGGWWSSLSNTDSALTPTTAAFHHVENIGESDGGFISLMDNPALTTSPDVMALSHQKVVAFEDEGDDLGLGNSAQRKAQDEPTKVNQDKPPAASVQNSVKEDEKRDPPATASTGSWLSRLWKRSDTPGPIKASLGEETSFYYDKELKRWVNKKVNKKAGVEVPQAPAPPPPPSRAQTASPSVSNSRFNGSSNGTMALPHPPPSRAASAIDLSTSLTSNNPMRARSHLVPTETASMPNTPAPSGVPNAPPPMGRSRSQVAKKNVRSRYVDVFQQDGISGAP